MTTARLALLLFSFLWTIQVSDAVRISPNEHDDQTTSTQQQQQQQQQKQGRRRRLSDEQKQQQQRAMLTKNVMVPAPTHPDDHLVTDLPLLTQPLSVAHWAGLLPASNEGDKYFFYWLFAPDLSHNGVDESSEIPLLIWLNGGPGCSSMDGLWLENGPLQLGRGPDGQWQITERPHSWHKAPAYTLYIDQPVGTGLSFTTSKNKYPRNDVEVNIDFYHFFLEFLQLHSDKFVDVAARKTSRPVYFSGESHAGHYIPSMMAYIQRQQQKQKTKQGDADKTSDMMIEIDLAGAAIGNGWIDPYHQYAAAAAAYGHSLIGHSQKLALDEEERKCQQDLSKGKYTSRTCFALVDKIVDESMGSTYGHKVSQYDVRYAEKKNVPRSFPPGHKDLEAYLGPGSIADTTKVLEAIHALPSQAAGQDYMECTDPPYLALQHQDGLGVTQDIIQLLNHNSNDGETATRMLFFNGVLDLMCNHVGNEIALEQLQWESQKQYRLAERSMWMAPSAARQDPSATASGYYKEYGPLSYLKVLNAGHMVPMDVPEISLDMMKIFMYHGSFTSSPQYMKRSVNGEKVENCPACPTCPEDGMLNGKKTLLMETSPSALLSEQQQQQQQEAVPPLMTFVIAHSWLGAIFSVVVFMGVYMIVRRRQARYEQRMMREHMELTEY